MKHVPLIRVLIIEDNPADICLIKDFFSEVWDVPFLVSEAGSLAEAVVRISEQSFDVILLDLSLPDSHGLVTLHHVHIQAPSIPIIILTCLDDDTLALIAMRQGAQDYLVKGRFDAHLLYRTIRYTIERKQAESEIKKLAYYDTLTGLPNRVLFTDRLKQAITLAGREKREVALLFLDLDNFKTVNDTLGHSHGDRLLKICADRIQGCLRSSDTVARIGGDEFVVVLSLVSSSEDVRKVAAKILEAMRKAVRFTDQEVNPSASIGIALHPQDGRTVDELLKNADTAMYQAKEEGRNNFKFFSREMNKQTLERQLIESSLRQAVSREEFYLLYQPQYNSNSRDVVGMEALIRWKHPQQGNILPLQFIDIAEETGMIIPIGEWALRTACHQAKQWYDSGYSGLRIAVNISARQFRQDNFVSLVSSILAETGLPPSWLELELKELSLMDRSERITDVLKKLKEIGISLAIDDYGTGFSSLAHLKDLPFDRLKIDLSFIRDINKDENDAAITNAIIVMAHSLNLQVIAEGVEQEDQVYFLYHRNCDELQGFLLGSPMPPEAMTHLLSSSSRSSFAN